MYIQLSELKKHLYVDEEYTGDDAYLVGLIGVSEEVISQHINTKLDSICVGGLLPLPIKHAILLFCGHLYSNREIIVVGAQVSKIPMSLEYLIQPYISYK